MRPPQVAADETQVWWQWTQNTIAHELAAHDKSARKHIAEALADLDEPETAPAQEPLAVGETPPYDVDAT